jgi:hypothetical protein
VRPDSHWSRPAVRPGTEERCGTGRPSGSSAHGTDWSRLGPDMRNEKAPVFRGFL